MKYNNKTAGVYFLNTYAGFEERKYLSYADAKFDIRTFQDSIVAAGSSGKFKYEVRSKMAIMPENVYIQNIHKTIETRKGCNIIDSGSTFLHIITPFKKKGGSWQSVGPICARYQLFSNLTGQFVKRLISRKDNCRA